MCSTQRVTCGDLPCMLQDKERRLVEYELLEAEEYRRSLEVTHS